MRPISLLLLTSIVLMTCCGCPDYSQLRSKPDYENMTDTGSETK